MSISMFIGRVILPGLGLGIAGLLIWEGSRSGIIELPPLPELKLAGWNPMQSQSTPSSAREATPKPSGLIVMAEGLVVALPGSETTLGAPIAGTIARVLVREKARVRRGDLLLEFQAGEQRAALDEAIARVAEVDAELSMLEQDYQRTSLLPAERTGTIPVRDRARSQLIACRARRSASAAAYRRLEAEFTRSRLYSPMDGVVITRQANPGETVLLGSPLFKIVDLEKVQVEAEVDEFNIPRCALGSRVIITAEGHFAARWTGKVAEIADAVAARKIRPEDPGRPSDSRVLPVRIALESAPPFKLGQRVEVQIFETTDAGEGGGVQNPHQVARSMPGVQPTRLR